ncbi:MAG: single-stranded DNA-binding protein [Gemmatimonadetes bacterium]|nr:single-stranded DNA-binding protein [Gemmatimonadota bacterium]
MSRSLNKVTLIGNLGNDPEIRTTTGGNKVAQFSLATGRQWNSASGEKQEKTEWHKCVAWNQGSRGTGLADIIERYVKKGDKLYVEGRIEYRQYQDKENQTRYVTEVNVREILLLGGGRGGSGGGSGGSGGSGGGDSDGGSSPRAKSADQGKGGDFEEFPNALEPSDDDLPF